MMYLGSYAYFDFDKNSPSYSLPLHTTYNNIRLTISCTSARQQFAVIHNRMFNSKLTIQLVPIIFVQFANTRVLTIVLP